MTVSSLAQKTVLVIAAIGFLWTNTSFAETDNQPMEKESRYQIVEITRDRSKTIPSAWDKDKDIADLKDMSTLIEESSSVALRDYFNQLTHHGEKSVLLKNGLPPREWVYYSRNWTKKDNLVRITGFKSLGSESTLNAYLGPIADIPTDRYGIATYAVDFEGETLTFTGPALKEIWSLRRRFWSNAQIYIPLDENAAEKIALIQVGLPVNWMDDHHGIYAIIPR